MDESSKKYDVAISLRWTDVGYARELFELLRDRLEVFFADKKQEEFVGTDGEESFGYIFRDQARVVVIFYRTDWGTTPYTRAEEAAIKQRAWNEGYGFSIWVPMDRNKSIPPYLPPQYVWFDLHQYGIKGLASVIEERVREKGREVRPESSTDRLRRISRRIDIEKKRRIFEMSQEGVNFVTDSRRRLDEVISNQIHRYNEISSDIFFRTEEEYGYSIAASGPYRCLFNIVPYARNSIRGAKMTATIKFLAETLHAREWRETEKFEWEPTLNDVGEPSWWLKKKGYYSFEMAVASVLDIMAEKVFLNIEKQIQNRGL